MKEKNKKSENCRSNSPRMGKMGKAKSFIAKYPGFIIALAAVIIILIIALFSNYSPEGAAEKAIFSQSLYEANQSEMTEYLQMIIEEQKNLQESTLEEAQLSSAKSDLEWLIAKEKELYNSRPPQEVYAKEIAFTLFAQQAIAASQLYLIELEEKEYEARIEAGLSSDYNAKKLLSEEEIDSTFSEQWEKEAYKKTSEALLKEYFNSKKIFITTISSKERKYIEAEKLLFLTEQ